MLVQGKSGIRPLCSDRKNAELRITYCCATSGDQRRFDFCYVSPIATPVEVFRLPLQRVLWFQRLARSSLTSRGHQVRRKAGRENGFWANSRSRSAQPLSQASLKTNFDYLVPIGRTFSPGQVAEGKPPWFRLILSDVELFFVNFYHRCEQHASQRVAGCLMRSNSFWHARWNAWRYGHAENR